MDQRCSMAPEGPPVIQHSVPPEDIRNFSQEGDPEKTQETDIMGDNGRHIEGQDARRTQERATLVDIENDNEEGEENKEEEDEEATTPVPAEAEEAAADNAADADADADADAEADADADAEAAEEKAKEEEAAATYNNTVEALQILQQPHIPKEGELYSQSEKSPQASALALLGSNKNQIKEGVEEAQSTPVWESWSQAVRESPKKQQPELPKKAKKPEVEAASQPQPVSGSGMNWVCPRCKAMNYSWRKVCFKCRR